MLRSLEGTGAVSLVQQRTGQQAAAAGLPGGRAKDSISAQGIVQALGSGLAAAHALNAREGLGPGMLMARPRVRAARGR